MPLLIAKISASFLEILPNPLITTDQLNLLKYDNVKSDNGITNFDIGCPSKIFFEEAIKKYAYNWREGGKFSIKKIDWCFIFMSAIILYISVLIIFTFVIFIAARAIYKNRYQNPKIDNDIEKANISNFTSELQKLSDLYKNGSISEEEFTKAKKKILDN